MINSYTSWQPLEEVIVGRAYSPDYFDFIDDPQVRQPDITRARQILGWEPTVDLEEGLRRTLAKVTTRV